MANPEPLPRGPLWGGCIALLAAVAWSLCLVPSAREEPRDWRDTAIAKQPGDWYSPITATVAALVVLTVGGWLGGYEGMPVTILLALAWGGQPALRRPGWLAMLLIASLYLPLLGTYGLWDPWETHYGEVAREILARNDWISLWWAQDNWFWSKPILLFWLEAWSMGALGVDFMPDANPAHPEWAVRLPTFVLGIVALAAVSRTVRRRFGARAGALSMLVIATMPLFFFVAHQAITDLPLVAFMTIAMCCLIEAIDEQPDRIAKPLRFGPVTLSSQHLIMGLVVFCMLPQALYLITRNVTLMEGMQLAFHPDRFLYGSAWNLDVPGNPPPRDDAPWIRGSGGQPWVQGVFWIVTLGWIARILRRETRAQRLWMFAFYLFCALAFMAKGLPGIAVPGAIALFYLIASRRWSLLWNGDFSITTGSLILAGVSLPWYLAMYVRHGRGFTNRLLIHDHINRLTSGVHGDTGTIEYYLAQLGYGLFPWVAMVPIAALVAVGQRRREGPEANTATDTATLVFVLWSLVCFILFSAMTTKFHHYILPALIPTGALVGIGIDSLWGPRGMKSTMVAALATLTAIVGFALSFGDLRGVVPESAGVTQDWVMLQGQAWWAWTVVALAAGLLIWARRVLRGTAATPDRRGDGSVGPGVALVVGACAVAFVGRDLSWATSARPQGNERLIHLFIYNYERPWPEHLDYRPILVGFAITATLLAALAAMRSWQPVAVRGFAVLAILFCAWGLNVYMIDLSDHWGMRTLAKLYYEDRAGEEEPLVAWQMNWKGENFYTGNRVHVFAALDNEEVKAWLGDNPGRTAYFVLEHTRLRNFRRLMGARPIRELSTKRDSNKFILVQVEI